VADGKKIIRPARRWNGGAADLRKRFQELTVCRPVVNDKKVKLFQERQICFFM
jgi:hypothetical protein